MATFDGVELEPVGGCRPWVAKRSALRKLGAEWLGEVGVNMCTAGDNAWQSSTFSNRAIKINYAHK